MKRCFASILLVCSGFACLAADPPKGLLNAPLLALQDVQAANLKLEAAPDGTRYVALRLRLANAPGVRLHIVDMQLVAGQKLIVSSSDGTEVFGPFDLNGPTNSGEFWTHPIKGSDAIVELQTGPDGVADLPFRIAAIESVEAADLLRSYEKNVVAAENASEVNSWFNGVPVTHSVTDGLAIYEGDIILGPANELPSAQPDERKVKIRSAVGITGTNFRWPDATIPYTIAAGVPNQSRIVAAIAHWNSVMEGIVRLVPRTDEKAYVQFTRPSNAGTCSSYIGKVYLSGAQPIQIGDYCSTGNVIHEIGHAFGLWHEHTREDRNNHVSVRMENVQTGQTHNFTQNIASGDDIGAYDYASIMHYHSTAFSSNGQPTIVTIPPGVSIGQRNSLSTGDIAGVKLLYPPAVAPPLPVSPAPTPMTPAPTTPLEPATVTVTINANPQGSPVTVDGIVYATPKSFVWAVGTPHSIGSADSSTNGTRLAFVNWSDSGSETHTITASSVVTSYKVDYAVAYSVKAAPSDSVRGTVSVSPASVDTYYASGTTVTLTATANAGSCFSGWTGLLGGVPGATAVVANKPYNLSANFQPGSITMSSGAIGIPKKGATLTLPVMATSGCVWQATTAEAWISLSGQQSGIGSGSLSVTADMNPNAVSRIGRITVAGKTLLIFQAAR